jgi:hypothetical protein
MVGIELYTATLMGSKLRREMLLIGRLYLGWFGLGQKAFLYISKCGKSQGARGRLKTPNRGSSQDENLYNYPLQGIVRTGK